MTEQTQLSAVSMDTSPTGLILNRDSMASMTQLATMMAGGKATLPKHFHGNPADCMAVIMQSMQWGMNPFQVAQKTFIVNGGQLSYEAQLVNAVITTHAPTMDRINYEWFGDWDKIMGNFREIESTKQTDDHGRPKKYRVPNWRIEDEKGLGIRVWATFIGEDNPRELTTLMTQARTRNSTLWADDPKQQIAYLALKKWARLYCPDVILGVYTRDELDEGATPPETDVTPKSTVEKPADAAAAIVPQGDAKEATVDLFDRLKKVAQEQGIEGYEKAWKQLEPLERGAIGRDRHHELKTIAQTIDAEFTNVTDTDGQHEDLQGAA